MTITTADIKKLRAATGAGIMDTKKALVEAAGDTKKAMGILRKQGQAMAAKKQVRETREGTIGYYIHSNGKVAAFVALACESDFVANTDDFKELAHDLAMQVAATDPAYIAPEDVPAKELAEKKEVFRAMLKKEKKPAKIWDKIIDGKISKYYSEVCFMKQVFVKDDKQTIEQLIHERILKLGENIQVKEIKKISL